jgi:hypothetical protein
MASERRATPSILLMRLQEEASLKPGCLSEKRRKSL